MSMRCPACEAGLEAEWVACPRCGRPVEGHSSLEKLVPIVAKVGLGLVETGLLQAEADAEESGERTRAAQIAVMRGLAKDVIPFVADAVLTYSFQRRRLAHDGRGGNGHTMDVPRRRLATPPSN
jgi:hypothetical protein